MKKKTKIIVGVVGGLSVIALGTFGIMYKRAAELVNTPSLYGIDPPSVSKVNDMYSYYIGEHKNKSIVKNIIEQNKFNPFGDEWKVDLVGIDDESQLSSGKYYTISIEEYKPNGAISKIRIEEEK